MDAYQYTIYIKKDKSETMIVNYADEMTILIRNKNI